MSRENVEIIRHGFEEFVRTGDFDPEDFDPEFEFDNTNAMLEAATYRGTEGLREFLSQLRDMWKQLRFEPQEYIPVGENHVVVPVRLIAIGRDGVETVAARATVFTLREQRITRAKLFQSKAEALTAAAS
jgi:ketosteroid isomerase-like protein